MRTDFAGDQIRAFVSWARENLGRIHSKSADDAASEISEALLQVDARLGVEIEEDVSDQRELIITAFSDPECFSLVREIISQLQALNGWRAVALKPPRGFDFAISMGGFEVQASDLEFDEEFTTGAHVRILVDTSVPLPAPEAVEELAWLLIETGIGEELAGRLQHVEFAVRPPDASAIPIARLAEYLRQRHDPDRG